MVRVGGAIGLIVVFLAVTILLYLGLSMISSVPTLEIGDEGFEEYEDLTTMVQLSFKGFEVVLLLLLLVVLISCFVFMFSRTRQTW